MLVPALYYGLTFIWYSKESNDGTDNDFLLLVGEFLNVAFGAAIIASGIFGALEILH